MSQVRRRPSLFSYFSFSKDAKARYGRSDSVTANLRHNDPYEKADRHSSSGDSSPGGAANGANMTNSGRARLLKTIGIVGLFFWALWVFVPADSRENAELVLKSGFFSMRTEGCVGGDCKIDGLMRLYTKYRPRRKAITSRWGRFLGRQVNFNPITTTTCESPGRRQALHQDPQPGSIRPRCALWHNQMHEILLLHQANCPIRPHGRRRLYRL